MTFHQAKDTAQLAALCIYFQLDIKMQQRSNFQLHSCTKAGISDYAGTKKVWTLNEKQMYMKKWGIFKERNENWLWQRWEDRVYSNKQTKQESKHQFVVIAYRTLELFHQDVFLFIPFLGTCSTQVGKPKPDWKIPFIHALSEQAWLVMLSSQSLSAAPKLQIWWGVGWGFLAPWSGWPLLAP